MTEAAEHPLDGTLNRLLQTLNNCLWDQLRVIADCCEEMGDTDMAAAYRWLACERRHPIRFDDRWCWRRRYREPLPNIGHYLPGIVMEVMELIPGPIGCLSNERESLTAAYRLAAEAIVEAKENGFGPLAVQPEEDINDEHRGY